MYTAEDKEERTGRRRRLYNKLRGTGGINQKDGQTSIY